MAETGNETARGGSADGAPPAVNKSLHTALRILDCFSEENPSWGVSALSRQLGLGKSTVSNMLATMAAFDLVEQSPGTRHYHIGLKGLELGFLASSRLLLKEMAYPYLESLLGTYNRIVYLAIPYGFEVLYIDALYPARRQVNVSAQGRRAPMYCTGIGKATLAYMPEEFLERYLDRVVLEPFTPHTLTEPAELRAELGRIRSQGYAVDRQEREIGIQCVAAPIRTRSGRLRAAISVSGAAGDIDDEAIPQLSQVLTSVARDISQRAGAAGI